ncbi:MAG: DUF4124 domain-containing protein [Colwellia sp.]|nr:DUF4124 domain-containing protein [Colwellia sp.]
MTFRIVCLALFFYFGHCSASELMIYRWVDKNNIVHFSQHQPVGDDYTEFLVSNQSKIISRADDATTPSMSDKSIYSEKNKISMSKQCEEAKSNVSMLMAFDEVHYINDKGIKQILNKQEKQKQLNINKKRTEFYCAVMSDG